MGRLINLMGKIKRAKVRPLCETTPFEPALIEVLSCITPKILDRLSSVSYKKAEAVLEDAFGSIPGIIFYPNGERRTPDMAFDRRKRAWWVEWKSAAYFGSSFQFNDSIPRGYIHYVFFSRKERRYIMMRGDDILRCIKRKRVEGIYDNVHKMREREKKEYGSKRNKSKDGVPPASTLIKFTPRMNPCIQNFLPFAKANGFFSLDHGAIWRPTVLGEKDG